MKQKNTQHQLLSGPCAASEAKAVKVAKMAKAVLHAMTARRPKTRYLVGPQARIGAFIATLCPTGLRDSLIDRNLRGKRGR